MEPLLKEQNKLVKIIKKIANQISKDSSARKTKEYGEARLLSLNAAWEDFENINIQIEALKDQYPEHKYFTENYYTQVETVYEQTRENIEGVIRDAIERNKNSDEIAEQVRQIKKQTAIIDTLKRNISNIKEDEGRQLSLVYYNQKIKLLTDYWEMIIHNHAQIMSLRKIKDDYFEQNMFAVTESLYQSTLIQLQEKLSNLSAAVPTSQPTNDYNATDKKASVKLPRIDIPNFSGDYLKWPSFRNLFMELVHKNEKTILPKSKCNCRAK